MNVKKYSPVQTCPSDNKNTSFKGLSAKLSKAAFDKNEIMSLYKQYEQKSQGKIGRLPSQWIYSIPFEKRSKTIKHIFETVGKTFAELLRKEPCDNKARKQAQKIITKLFRQAGILRIWQRAKLKYIDSGSFGDVYRLDVKKESYAVKVYKSLFQNYYNSDNYHGNFYEQAIAQYMKGKISKRNNNWFKFYFGDLKYGIMVSRFEQGSRHIKKKPFNALLKIGLLFDDREQYSERNSLNGIIIDNGGGKILKHAKNKTMRYVFAKTMKEPAAPLKILEKTLQWKPSRFYNDRLKGVFYSLQITSEETAKNCLDLLLPAADKEVSAYIAKNINYAPINLRPKIFYALYSKNDINLDKILAAKLDYIDAYIGSDSRYLQLLRNRKEPEIDKILKSLYSL